MTELARLMPEILADHPNLEPPGPLQESWQIHRFHEALGRAFVAQTPRLLLIHNLQWSDPQSLRWLAFLQRFAPEHPHLIVASLLRDELGANPLLPSLLDTLEAQGYLTRIPIPEKPADLVRDEFAEDFYLAPGLVGHAS
jgi:predicted ATPase